MAAVDRARLEARYNRAVRAGEQIDAESRLDSWKEIAAYLRRSERTVRRWEEKEELPVHRLQHEKRGTVFAYKHELDAWWESKKVVIEVTDPAPDADGDRAPLGTSTEATEPSSASSQRRARMGWLVALVVSAALAVATYLLFRGAPVAPATLAVFPFAGAADSEHLRSGIAETLVHHLSQAPDLRVRPFESAIGFRGKAATATDAARAMGVRFAITGNLRHSGEAIAANVALIDVSSDAQVWGESYTVPESGLAQKQQSVAIEIRRQLLRRLHGPEYEPGAFRPGGTDTRDPEAFRAFLKGQNFFHSPGHSGMTTAIGFLEEAVRRDPHFARAYASLAAATVGSTWFADAPAATALVKAKNAAQRAIELDATLARGWAILGATRHYLDYDHAAAEKYTRRARDLGSGYFYAVVLTDLARFPEALRAWEQVLEELPSGLTEQSEYGFALYAAGRTGEARALLGRTLQAEPNMGLARLFMARVALTAGRQAEAIEHLRRGSELLEHSAFAQSELGYGLGVSGQREQAEQILAGLLERREKSYVPAYAVALVHLGSGRTQAALDWLERAIDERNVGYWSPYIDPVYKPLRKDARFQQVLRRMNLP